MSCGSLTAGLTITCAALERVGGIKKKVWIGNLDDIASYTISTNVITAITMTASKYFYAFVGNKDKNSTAVELQVGETVNAFKQIVNLVLYTSTSAEEVTIENLCRAKNLVVIVEANDGQFEVYGLDVNAGSASYPYGGLSVETATKNSGVLINERQHWTVSLSGITRNSDRKFFNTDYATTITAIEALEP